MVVFSADLKQRVPKPNDDSETKKALKRLDIDFDELDALPSITETLMSCFNKTGDDYFPRKQVINFLAGSTAPAAVALLEEWRKIPKHDLSRVSIEAVCLKAEVSPLEILGAIMMAARTMKGQESALKAILAHPEVVGATIETAMLIGPAGDTSRRMLHEATTFLPMRNGQSIAINLGAPKKDGDEGGDGDDEQKFYDAFPTISGSLEKWSERRRNLSDGS